MEEELDALVDVTIIYPQNRVTGRGPTFWELLSGDIPEIIVRAERRNIPPELLGRNFRTDRTFRGELEVWMSQLWQEKDGLISSILND